MLVGFNRLLGLLLKLLVSSDMFSKHTITCNISRSNLLSID